MNGAEALLFEKKSNEILMLRGYVERVGSMICGRMAWGETSAPPEDCECFSCTARECIETIEVMREVYRHAPQG